MATTVEATQTEVERAVASAPGDQLLERLADLVGSKAGVQAVFGEPIRQGDLTVVPVARVRWGFGGGGGRSGMVPQTPAASGSGGGGGVMADPLGYLEIRPAGVTYSPIGDQRPSPAFMLAAGFASAIIIRALARLLRG